MPRDVPLQKRLLISDADLHQAKEFANFLIKKGLHSKRGKEAELVRLAFNTALIVCYSRPFKRNKSSTADKVQSSLPNDFLDVLTPDERCLHEIIIAGRDTKYAHSDADSYSIEVSIGHGTIAAGWNYPFIPLTEKQTIQLISVIDKLRDRIFQRLHVDSEDELRERWSKFLKERQNLLHRPM